MVTENIVEGSEFNSLKCLNFNFALEFCKNTGNLEKTEAFGFEELDQVTETNFLSLSWSEG